MLNHKHIIGDFYFHPNTFIPMQLDNNKGYRIFMEDIVKAVEMNTLSDYKIYDCFDEGNEGQTGCVILVTSHFAWHSWPAQGRLSFDLYSCKDFDENKVIDTIEKHFGKYKQHFVTVLDRNHDDLL